MLSAPLMAELVLPRVSQGVFIDDISVVSSDIIWPTVTQERLMSEAQYEVNHCTDGFVQT